MPAPARGARERTRRLMIRRRQLSALGLAGLVLALSPSAVRAAVPDTITLDWAYYNPVSLVLKEKAGSRRSSRPTASRSAGCRAWAPTRRSSSSTPARSTSARPPAPPRCWPDQRQPDQVRLRLLKPEWTALVTRPDSRHRQGRGSQGQAHRRRPSGTDPYIFLLRALGGAGLSQSDMQLVLLQHDQGRRRSSAATSTPGPASTR